MKGRMGERESEEETTREGRDEVKRKECTEMVRGREGECTERVGGRKGIAVK